MVQPHRRAPSQCCDALTQCPWRREAELNPAAVTSWPVRGDWLLNTPDGPKPLVEGYREAWKVWKTKASEARGLAGLMTYIAWCADPVAMAAKLGHDESDRYKATLLVLDAVRAGKRVEIVGTAPCYVHLSGVPGVPQFVARMQPEIIMRSEDAIDEVPLGERATHWLSSPSRDGKTVWETSPYLLVGTGAWDTDVASFPEPAMARYGRVGAPGSPWWVMVKLSDK